MCKLDSIKFISPLEAAPVEEKGAEVEEKQNFTDVQYSAGSAVCYYFSVEETLRNTFQHLSKQSLFL